MSLVTLGCARNDVDSEELAGRLADDGWTVVDGPEVADVVLVNTCGFIDAAKADSIDTILDLSAEAHRPRVVATGCMAERYGRELAEQLPEADAVIGFDHYPTIGKTLAAVLAGEKIAPHEPTDRRTLLPITPVDRPAASVVVPGHGDASAGLGGAADRIVRHRLSSGPVAPLKIASGCDRRCAFCAIPRFRGAFVSRHPADVVAEARLLAESGVREVVLVSENSTSYGKDFGRPDALPDLLAELAGVPGLARVRVSYLQPAEIRPSLLREMAGNPVVAPYYDLSFQHAAGPLLRRMRRFGDAESFLALIDQVRSASPEAGIRSNVIVGFPGETEADVETLLDFLTDARLDAVGVFGYSDEEGTEGAELPDKVDPDEIATRVAAVMEHAADVTAERAADRIGQRVTVLIEDPEAEQPGRAQFQGPEDGAVRFTGPVPPAGEFVEGDVVGSDGVDLVAQVNHG